MRLSGNGILKKYDICGPDLKADGTGHFVNYAGKASDGKWTLEDNFFLFEAGGERSGGIAKMEGEILKVDWVAEAV
jgi:hypothetical protein